MEVRSGRPEEDLDSVLLSVRLAESRRALADAPARIQCISRLLEVEVAAVVLCSCIAFFLAAR